MNSGRKGFLLPVVLLMLAVLDVWYFAGMYRLTSHGMSDFASFYAAGKIVRQHAGISLYSLQTQAEIQAHLFPSVRPAPLVFARLPYEALIFLPFSFLPFAYAYIVWCLTRALGLLIGCAALLRNFEGLRPKRVWVLLGVLAFPPIVDITVGQDATLLFLLYALAFDRWERRQTFWAGFLVGLGLFKFQFVLPFIVAFVHRTRRNLLLGFGMATAVILLISLWIVGPQGAESYFALLYFQMWHMPEAAAASSPTMMPNIRGLVFAALRSHISRTAADALTLVMSLLLVSLLFVVARKVSQASDQALPKERELNRLVFSLAIAVTLLVSYHAHIYDLTLLTIPIFVLADRTVNQLTPATECVAVFLLGAPLYMFVMYYRLGFLLCLVPLAVATPIVAFLLVRTGQRQPGAVVPPGSLSASGP